MTVFDWLNEITVKKTPIKNFTQQDWDDWNSYMVHRFLSMNPNYFQICYRNFKYCNKIGD